MRSPIAERGQVGRFLAALFLLFVSLSVTRGAEPATLVAEERFGVGHPDQLIEFDLGEPRSPQTTSVTDDAGRAVPFQLLEGGRKLAVRADLPAKSKRSWRLVPGQRPAAEANDAVVVKQDAGRGWYEITNGITGVRVPAPGGAGAGLRAPVQGVLLRSGRWLDSGPDLRGPAGGTMQFRFVERGPLVTIAEVTYAFSQAGQPDRHYRCTVQVQAGQPSVLFEEEADAEVAYSIRLDELHPTQARYRGHHSTSKDAGYEADGRQYRQAHERPQVDAFVDLKFDAPREYRRLPAWDPWVYDGGWYWQIYDRDAAPGADMVAPFAGRASRALNPRDCGVNVATGGAPGRAELVVTCKPTGPAADAKGAASRFSWGLFVATKAELAPPDQVQPVGRQMNLHAGINLNKVARLELDFPDPPGGYGSPYMSRAAVERMIARLRADAGGPQGGGYYARLYDADSYSRDLIDFWADPTGDRAHKAVEKVRADAHGLLDALVNENGVYSFQWHYWMGGLVMVRDLLWIDQILASPAVGAEDKAAAKAAAVLFASVLWDNDFVPMDNHEGINLGTPNMPVQESGYRDQFALFLGRHPMMRPHVEGIVRRTSDNLRHDINEHGSHMSSVHYVGAGMGPTLSIMQQLKTAGIKDFFRDEPRVARFAEFFMSCATPPEVRFGGGRRLISVGDGSTESSELFGQMATGFADVDPDLSRRLMHVWRDQGRPHSSFFGTTLLKVDEDLPEAPQHFATANFPGYHTVLRQAPGTPLETAVWLVNGNHYWDHSHADQGEVVIYALGAPLSLDWGSTYEPRVDSAFMHSLALPERVFNHPWAGDGPPVTEESRWGTFAGTKTTQDAFRAGPHGGFVRAGMTAPGQAFTWTRSVALDRLGDDLSVILVRDTYAGREAQAPKVFTLNLMAEGDVETPGGKVTPAPRLRGYESNHGDRRELPSAGNVFDIPAGVVRLGFTGQTWNAHPSKGIDFDVYVVADAPQQAHVGNWAHAWHPGSAAGAFQKTNGRPFEERQHILRIRGNGGFAVVLVPYQKGTRRPNAIVRRAGDGIEVSDGQNMVRFPGGD